MTVRTEKDGAIWTVIHSRFDAARNAMDPESADALVEQLQTFDRDPSARVAAYMSCNPAPSGRSRNPYRTPS